MKTVRCLGLAVLLATPLFADWPTTSSFMPIYEPNVLIVALDKTPSVSELPVMDAIAEAVRDVADVTPSLGDPLVVHLSSKSHRGFGEIFRVIQSFSFADFPGYSIRWIQPSYYLFIPEVHPVKHRRVFNFSARAEVGAGDSVTIGGIVVPGEFPRRAVFKVRGASLANFNLEGSLTDPRMTLFVGDTPVLSNDNWTTLRDWEKSLAAHLCPPPDDERESMIVTYLNPGAYTAIVNAPVGESGVVLLEVYLEDTFYVQ